MAAVLVALEIGCEDGGQGKKMSRDCSQIEEKNHCFCYSYQMFRRPVLFSDKTKKSTKDKTGQKCKIDGGHDEDRRKGFYEM